MPDAAETPERRRAQPDEQKETHDPVACVVEIDAANCRDGSDGGSEVVCQGAEQFDRADEWSQAPRSW
ncbi:hypothetical protein GCM10027090_39570 [Sinomonas soli]